MTPHLAPFGAAIPQVSALTRALEVSAGFSRIAQHTEHLSSHLSPLASSLAQVSRTVDRVSAKRRRVVCKLGRRASNRSTLLAALEVLSLETLERVLDNYLNGEEVPEELHARLELLAWLRFDTDALEREVRRRRAERLEERGRPERRPRLSTRARKPSPPRSVCRPVGSLAPPVSARTPRNLLTLPRGWPM